MVNDGARLDRRGLLAGAAGVAVGAALAGCSGTGGASNDAGAVDSALLPTYTPFAGVKPDLAGEVDRCSDAFMRYPSTPQPAVDAAPGDGNPITALVPTSFPAPSPVGRNAFWQELNNRVGSELKINIVTSSDYTAKFATTVAGGQLPDFFHINGDGVQSLPQFMEKAAADLTPHLSGDAISAYPALANIPADSWKACVFNGAIRAIPISRGLTNLPVLFARTDLLADQGITEDPADFSSFLAMCQQLTSARARKFALAGAPLGHVRSMLDIPHSWAVQDGRFVSTVADPRQLEALEALRTLQAEGVIHPDGVAIGTPVKKQWFGAGSVFMLPDSFIAWFSLHVQNTAVEGFELHALTIPGFDGGQGTQLVPIPNVGITAINAESADRVPTLLAVANWLAAPFGSEEYLFLKFGLPEKHYTLEGTDPVVIPETAGDVQVGALYMADAARVLYSPGRQSVVEQAYAYQRTATEKSVKDATLGLYSETASRKGKTLTSALTDVENAIIAGRRPVKDWETAAADYLKNGGQQIADEYTEAHAAMEAQ